MKAPTRRAAMGAFLGFGVAAAALPGSVFASSGVAIPTRPMLLSRILERSLRGGAILRVARDWQVSFDRQGQGIAVSGAQLSASVDPPAELAPLAEIEQTRSTEDMWPILLSSDGQIVAAGTDTREEDLAEAIRVAEQIIATRPRPAEHKAEQRRYLADMQRAGTSLLDRLPTDLFFPVGDPQRSVQSLDLPGGMSGEFEVSYAAECAADAAWLSQAVREVVTRIGDSERRAREEWSLREI